MSENRFEILAGLIVLCAAVGFAAYAGRSAGVSVDNQGYVLRASFRSVDGVSVGTDVRLAGVKVGRVAELHLNPKTFFADAVLELNPSVQLPDDSSALISSEGLLGGNFVELSPGGSATNFAPGDEIEDTQGAVSVISLMMKFAGGGSSDKAAAPAAGTGTAP